MAGYRVLRGPDWEGGETDGGEGHLGTITELLSNGRVHVVWDTGQETTCRAGADGKFDLRLFDTGPSGVRHPSAQCHECGEKNIYGALWRCRVCARCDLCFRCYSEDKHDIRHRFVRIDSLASSGKEVKPRKTSVKMRAMGIFPGSKVTRGKHWMWEDQDGGPGTRGEVQGFENVAPDSTRNLVRVLWPNGLANSYRLGFQGQVDLTCVEEEIGLFYYRDHLQLADASELPLATAPIEASAIPPSGTASRSSTRLTPSPTALTSTSAAVTMSSTSSKSVTTSSSSSQSSLAVSSPGRASLDSCAPAKAMISEVKFPEGDPSRAVLPEGNVDEDDLLVLGDKAVIGVDEKKLAELQEMYGGCTQGMIRRIGVQGVVVAVASAQSTAIIVRYTEKQSYRLNPAVLVKVTPFTQGDVARVRRDVKQVKFLNTRLGWSEEMEKACGKVGRVSGVASNGDVTVRLDGQELKFAASCLLPALGTPLDDASAEKQPDEKAPGDLSAILRHMAGRASSQNDSDFLTRLLGRENNGENCNPRVRTLFSAIQAGHAGAVRRMVEDDRGLLAETHKNLTPLGSASRMGFIDVMDILLELGADINGRDGKGRSPLMCAIEGTEPQAAFHLIDRGAEVNLPSHSQQTPLHYAAIRNMPEVIQRLILCGSDINAMDSSGDTPLFDAISYGMDQAVETLLQIPFLNKHIRNFKGFNMLQYACLRGRPRAVELMLELQDRPDVDDRLDEKYTALHIAANNDHVECIGLLILLGGANIDHGDGSRQLTPLHLACKRGQFMSAQCLIEMGANVNAIDIYGNTPLHLAMGKVPEGDSGSEHDPKSGECECIRLARLLIDSGAFVDALDYSGRTPLDYGGIVVQTAVRHYIAERGDAVLHYGITEVGPVLASGPSPATTVSSLGDSGTADLTLSTPESSACSKQHDTSLLQGLLKGVRLQCATCDAMSDVTLEPCGHKSVCRKCSDGVTRCPVCGADVQDREIDDTDNRTTLALTHERT